MSKQIGFSYGVLFDSLEEQANKLGYTLGNQADKFEKLRESLNMVKFHNLFTDSQIDNAFKKLHSKVVKSLKPLGNR